MQIANFYVNCSVIIYYSLGLGAIVEAWSLNAGSRHKLKHNKEYCGGEA